MTKDKVQRISAQDDQSVDWEDVSKKYHKRPRKSNRTNAPLCKGTTVWGTPCQQLAMGGTEYCRFHNPRNVCAYRDGRHSCKRPVVSGSEYCQHHLEIIGRMSQNVLTSRTKLPSFLKFLPSGLAERAAEVSEDPDLTNIRNDIVLYSTRLTELIEALKNPTTNYYDMLVAFNALDDAMHAGDEHTASVVMVRLRELLNEGISTKEAWQEIYEVMELRQKAINLEHKQLMEDGGMIPVQQVMALMTRVLMIISTIVKSPDEIRAIKSEFDRLVLLRDPRQLAVDAEPFA